MKRLLILLLILTSTACTKPTPTEVLVLPTLHGAHQMNRNYTYEDVMKIIDSYHPDKIGIEIRPVDLGLESDSLRAFYPKEMVSVRDSFPEIVTGIDNYSASTEKIRVSKKLFTDSSYDIARIKNLLANMQQDTLILKKYEEAGIPEIMEEQIRIAKNYSAEEFLKGEYDSLTGRQYFLEDSIYKNTPYEIYSKFNNRRDLDITQNALKLITNNPGKRILILVGANHRNRLVDSLKMKKSSEVNLIQDLSFLKSE